MARYFIELSYKGTNYHGWQVQKNAIGVQQLLNRALSLKLGKAVETTGSGRTDKGVHALQQYAHFDFSKLLNERYLVFQLNQVLPNDISVKNIYEVVPEAHARFDAVSRSYMYRINFKKDPFLIDTSYYRRGELDIDLMNDSAIIFQTTKDFESFSKVKTDVNHFKCAISRSEWVENGDHLNYYVTADRFLRGMVRAIVGTMLDIGAGKSSLEDLRVIINSLDRKKAGRAAPAHGLYLTEVRYPFTIFLNNRPWQKIV
jgi:tRNA pseudouridine38-40 synthase